MILRTFCQRNISSHATFLPRNDPIHYLIFEEEKVEKNGSEETAPFDRGQRVTLHTQSMRQCIECTSKLTMWPQSSIFCCVNWIFTEH